ncbi:hypothetical protein SS50377_28610 [Spironucleus salmonicida]|uniref:Transmembrane protein n=1 Tax=Spironucleus salmonicida TaxID=348837 RepID=V6LAT9_9EUKA|nr:hypothetical protein SS50377_28721 [Spironucleus salmonicida]KAH0569654.1 hypothetical protein SS50377_28610 [Spironucleus salmonicida]|eukprot:EST41570.1 Hypothetical protein SS50377_18910 [Spironucleus salmonicida]
MNKFSYLRRTPNIQILLQNQKYQTHTLQYALQYSYTHINFTYYVYCSIFSCRIGKSLNINLTPPTIIRPLYQQIFFSLLIISSASAIPFIIPILAQLLQQRHPFPSNHNQKLTFAPEKPQTTRNLSKNTYFYILTTSLLPFQYSHSIPPNFNTTTSYIRLILTLQSGTAKNAKYKMQIWQISESQNHKLACKKVKNCTKLTENLPDEIMRRQLPGEGIKAESQK